MSELKIEPIGYTLAEAAQALRISERAMSALLKSGKIPAVKISNRIGWRVDPQAIRDFVLSGTSVDIEDTE